MQKYYLFTLLVFLLACTKEVDIDTDLVPKQLVVNCFFTENEAFKVNVSRLANYTDTLGRALNNANVKVYADDVLLGQLYLVKNGIYSNDNITPKKGKQYKVEVTVPGYSTASGTDSLPYLTPIQQADIFVNAGIDSDGEPYDKIAVTFTDLEGDNYYSIMIYDSWITEKLKKRWYPLQLFSSDPAIIAEGISEGEFPEYFVFNDELFEGQTYKLYVNIGSYIDLTNGIAYLDTGSEAFYRYRKSLLKHKPYPYQSPFEPYEPTPIYSNIKNGLGIFAGYQRSLYNIPNN